MKTKKDYSHLPIEEQIKKLNLKIKFTIIFGLVFNMLVAIASILIWHFTEERKLAIGFLISVPISLFLGFYIYIKEYTQEIRKLQEEQQREEEQENNYRR